MDIIACRTSCPREAVGSVRVRCLANAEPRNRRCLCPDGSRSECAGKRCIAFHSKTVAANGQMRRPPMAPSYSEVRRSWCSSPGLTGSSRNRATAIGLYACRSRCCGDCHLVSEFCESVNTLAFLRAARHFPAPGDLETSPSSSSAPAQHQQRCLPFSGPTVASASRTVG
jgi:hypothetical protein